MLECKVEWCTSNYNSGKIRSALHSALWLRLRSSTPLRTRLKVLECYSSTTPAFWSATPAFTLAECAPAKYWVNNFDRALGFECKPPRFATKSHLHDTKLDLNSQPRQFLLIQSWNSPFWSAKWSDALQLLLWQISELHSTSHSSKISGALLRLQFPLRQIGEHAGFTSNALLQQLVPNFDSCTGNCTRWIWSTVNERDNTIEQKSRLLQSTF